MSLIFGVLAVAGFWLLQTQAQEAEEGENVVEVEIGASKEPAKPGPLPQTVSVQDNVFIKGLFGVQSAISTAINIWVEDNGVGIGTMTPIQKLHVIGTGQVDVLRLGDTGTDTIFWDLQGEANNDLTFKYGGELMRLTPGGNLGIGTTTPGQKLTVVGTIESTSGGFKFPDATVQTTADADSDATNELNTTVVLNGTMLARTAGARCRWT